MSKFLLLEKLSDRDYLFVERTNSKNILSHDDVSITENWNLTRFEKVFYFRPKLPQTLLTISGEHGLKVTRVQIDKSIPTLVIKDLFSKLKTLGYEFKYLNSWKQQLKLVNFDSDKESFSLIAYSLLSQNYIKHKTA